MSTPSDQSNRYTAPQAEVEDVKDDSEVGELAGRGDRLGAYVLDVLTWFLSFLPLLIGFGVTGIQAFIAAVRTGTRAGFENVDNVQLGIAALITVATFLLVVGLNIYFVVKNRQTIGKKLVGIKVTRSDGSQVSIARLFFLRNLVNAIPGMIPVIKNLYWLVDCLFIFGEQRRCVHDYIADTIVVKA